MKNPFDNALTFTLQFEGKTSTDLDDPGNWTGGAKGVGEFKGTKYGISAAAFPHVDIQALTLEQARELYHRYYWLPCGAHRIVSDAPQLAYRLFDLSVNCGVAAAGRMLQLAVNTVCTGHVLPRRRAPWRQTVVRLLYGQALRVDGIVGPVTAEVIRICPHKTALLAALKGEAYNHYHRLDPANIPGWLNRLGS